MADVPISDNFSLRISGLDVKKELSGVVGRDPHLGFNPGKITFEASLGVQIIQSLDSLLGRVALKPNEHPPDNWQIGFYQIVHNLKRIVIFESRRSGLRAAASRSLPGPMGMSTSGFEYMQTTTELTEPYRDASDTIDESDDPWYDTNSTSLDNFKRTYQNISRGIHTSSQSVKLSMADSPGVVPHETSRSAIYKVRGLKQEVSFTTFLLLLNAPNPALEVPNRDFVFILTSWGWTANFVYAELGNRHPLSLGGIIVNSTDTTPKFKREMPYPLIGDRPVAKTILNQMHPAPVPVMDVDLLLRL